MNNLVVEGLWQYPIDHYLDIIETNGFNALRIPFSVDMMYYKNTTIPDPNLVQGDPSLYNMTSLEIMDMIVHKCGERGIVVLLDCHRTSMSSPSPRWYIPGNRYFTEEIFMENWRRVLDHFSVYPNLLGVEIYNEPHGDATMAEFSRMIVRLLDSRPNDGTLFFVDGVEWGHDLRDLRNDNPLINYQQIIYTPHIYGPTLTPLLNYTQEYVNYLYHDFFGFLQEEINASLCITEWGYNDNLSSDRIWAQFFVKYLISNNIHNNFFWVLNPNGRDIKGLLKPDWITVDKTKMKTIQQLAPNPTFFPPLVL
jgi:endoglucanase